MDTRSERPPISQDNYPAADDLFPAETLDDAAIRRIGDVLSAPSWRWLTTTVRDAWERNLSWRRISIDISALSDAEAAAMADFFRWPTHRSGITTISLTRLDALLRASGLSAGLAACLTATGGPLHDEAGRCRADKAALRAANDDLWADAAVHPAFQRHPPLAAWLADERRTGRLPADLPVRRHVLFDALSVLAAVPDPGTGLARFANRILGNAHALDDGPVQGAACPCATRPAPPGSSRPCQCAGCRTASRTRPCGQRIAPRRTRPSHPAVIRREPFQAGPRSRRPARGQAGRPAAG